MKHFPSFTSQGTVRPRGVLLGPAHRIDRFAVMISASATPTSLGNSSGTAFRPGIYQLFAVQPAHANWLALAPKPTSICSPLEWNYGEYEGLPTAEIRSEAPGLATVSRRLSRRGVARRVGARADRVVNRCARSRAMF